MTDGPVRPETLQDRIDTRDRALYYQDEDGGKSYIRVVKCPVCLAIVEDCDLSTHEEVMHPDPPIEMQG